MAQSLVYIGTHTVKPGHQDMARQRCRELVEHLEANHPRLLHFACHFDEDGGELTIVQVHPDEHSLRLHLQVAGERIAQAYEFLQGTTDIQIYGSPSDELVTQIHTMAGGASVSFHVADCGLTRQPATVV